MEGLSRCSSTTNHTPVAQPASPIDPDDALTILLAGHDTIATALVWTWVALARFPKSRQMETEVDTVLDGSWRLPAIFSSPVYPARHD